MPQVRLPESISKRAAAGAARGEVGKDAPFLWEGPCGEGPDGGVTQSMLSRFLTCPERFRLAYCEGWKPVEQFNHRFGYGDMWHVCEEVHASGGDRDLWPAYLKTHCQELVKKHRMQQEAIEHWYQVCKAQFPCYVEWWSKHRETVTRTPLLQEAKFDVPHRLPSGRTVRLRGKIDAVDLIGKGKDAGIWIQDHKTKGDVDPEAIKRQMGGDLQLMYYMLAVMLDQNEDGALSQANRNPHKPQLKGVRYNVVRRALSGGKGTIVRGKATRGAKCGRCKGEGKAAFKLASKRVEMRVCPKCGGQGRIGAKAEEPAADFYQRLGEVIRDAHGPEWDCPPGEHHFFKRWTAEVTPSQLSRFVAQTLDPILERLFDWWQWVNSSKGRLDPFADGGGKGLHWRHPYGAENAIDTWGSTDLDALADSGSTVGLRRRDHLFEELRP